MQGLRNSQIVAVKVLKRARGRALREGGTMSIAHREALVEAVAGYDEITAALDEKTMAILEHRRKTAVVKRRGWLIRRLLLLADVVGLSVAFIIAH